MADDQEDTRFTSPLPSSRRLPGIGQKKGIAERPTACGIVGAGWHAFKVE